MTPRQEEQTPNEEPGTLVHLRNEICLELNPRINHVERSRSRQIDQCLWYFSHHHHKCNMQINTYPTHQPIIQYHVQYLYITQSIRFSVKYCNLANFDYEDHQHFCCHKTLTKISTTVSRKP